MVVSVPFVCSCPFPQFCLQGISIPRHRPRFVRSDVDGPTGLPVYSAYKFNSSRLASVLVQLNVTAVVIDLQDVGVRLYTFIWTMRKLMQASAVAQVILVSCLPTPFT